MGLINKLRYWISLIPLIKYKVFDILIQNEINNMNKEIEKDIKEVLKTTHNKN